MTVTVDYEDTDSSTSQIQDEKTQDEITDTNCINSTIKPSISFQSKVAELHVSHGQGGAQPELVLIPVTEPKRGRSTKYNLRKKLHSSKYVNPK